MPEFVSRISQKRDDGKGNFGPAVRGGNLDFESPFGAEESVMTRPERERESGRAHSRTRDREQHKVLSIAYTIQR